MEHPARACLAEIVVTAGDGSMSRGSGYLVASGWVLTAAHVVHGARNVGVWLGAPTELLTGDGHRVESVRTVAGTDLALVLISVDATPPGYVRPVLGAVYRDDAAETAAVAVGFPWFKLRPAPDRPKVNLREVHYAVGRIVGGSNTKTGTLEFSVADAPDRRPDPDASPWEGMSGGPLFTQGRLVGVVGQHHPSEGTDTLTARPLLVPDDIATRLGLPADPVRHAWKELLPQLGGPLPVVTPPTKRELSAKRAQAAARRLLPADGVLIAREDELTDLARFATGDQQWRWLRAEAFAGKTALLAYFALHPPEGVDVVACFLRSTTGENTAAHALKVLDEQIAGLHGVRPGYQAPQTVPDLGVDFIDDLLPAAATAACQVGRPLLVVIDGLDEYDPTAMPTLTNWLPAALPDGVRLLVASRSGAPVDLPEGHPLTAPDAQHRIGASEVASQVQQLALTELQTALRQAGELTYEVAGCLAATGGGISLTDLNAWLIRRGTRRPGDSSKYLADRIGVWFHRSVYTIDDPDGPEQGRLVFGHESLQHAYQEELASDLTGLRDELHDWANQCQQARWPPDTPAFFLTGYRRLLKSPSTPTTPEWHASVQRLTALLDDEAYQRAILEAFGWLYPYVEDVKFLAAREPAHARHICLSVMKAKRPNSYLRRQMLSILTRLPTEGTAATRSRRPVGLEDVVWVLQQHPVDCAWLQERYSNFADTSQSPVRSALLLALGRVGGPENADFLLEVLRSSEGRTAWAAADALIDAAAADRAVKHQIIQTLIGRFLQARGQGDQQRILYVLGFVRAEDARTLAHDALSSGYQRTAGWAIHLLQEIGPTEQDLESWLDELEQVTKGQAQGPWRGLWAQKRLVRGLHHSALSREQCVRATELAGQLLPLLKDSGLAHPSPERNSLFVAAQRLRERPCPT